MEYHGVKLGKRKLLANLIGLAVWLLFLCPACTLQANAQPFATPTHPEPTLTASDQLLLDGLSTIHGETSTQLAGTRWRLMMAVVQGKHIRTFDGQPALEFISSNQYRGYDGCNGMTGVYHASLTGEFVHAGERTEKNCLKANPAKTMVPYETDTQFYEWFQQSRAFQIIGSELRIFVSGDHSDVLIFTKNNARLPNRRRFGFSNP